MSKTVQNDLLSCIKDYIQQQIVAEIHSQSIGALYGIQADEVTDISKWEQLGLVIRYLKDGVPCERLPEFISCDNVRGESICQNITASLGYLGLCVKLPCSNLRRSRELGK